jgi:hypothetical protein
VGREKECETVKQDETPLLRLYEAHHFLGLEGALARVGDHGVGADAHHRLGRVRPRRNLIARLASEAQ